MDVFEEYFRRADLDQDGKISGAEAVAFFQASNLPKNVLAQVWTHADQNQTGFLGRPEFFNALKLVTVAQSGRQLTPEIVKSALFGPAAAKIPAPKINPVSSTTPQLNSSAIPIVQTNSLRPPLRPPSNQYGGLVPSASQNIGIRPPAPQNAATNQQFFPTANSNFMRPPQVTPASAPPHMQGVNLGLVGAGNVTGPLLPSSNITGPRLPTSNISNIQIDLVSNNSSETSVGGISQTPIRGSGSSQSPDGFGLAFSGMMGAPSRPQTQPAPNPSDLSFQRSKANESKALAGNDFSSNSFFGGDAFSATQSTLVSNASFSSNNTLNPSGIARAAAPQSSIGSGQLGAKIVHLVPSAGSQPLQAQLNAMNNQSDNLKASSTLAATNGAAVLANSAQNEAQIQWPKITQADIKKYANVFNSVDKDRDGKITGEQARMLFLSWKLPREVLKQVWDLSDQDNDSMLSLMEFCIALYLMERYREGRPLPSTLPSSVMYDETLLRAAGMASAAYGVPGWQSGIPQQGLPGSHPVTSSGIRPPMQNPMPSQAFIAGQAVHKNLGKPGLNGPTGKDLGPDTQNTVNLNQEPANADSKVQEPEKLILDSREKIELYRTKMQELVLYKSRCDNRLNEITERASSDKREVEMLGKKYEEKYKQVAEIASKLALEEAKYRDIQERKMELHNAIIKMEQGGSADGLLQVRVDRIQTDLEGLEKVLNERCKQQNVHVKTATSIELPFGWESGPLEGAADWDEDWDKFEDEGFTVVKDLSSGVTDDVDNGGPKSPTFWSDKVSAGDNSPVASNFDSKNENFYSVHEHTNGSAYDHSEEGSTRSPTSTPGRSTLESPFNSTQFHDASPHHKERHNDRVDEESTFSGDKYTDEPWSFDDADSVWKEVDYDNSQNSVFASDFGWIKVDSPGASSAFGKEKRSTLFDDSVPSSPMFRDGRDDYSFSRFDSFATQDSSAAFPARETFSRFDSISSSRPETLTRFDSISSTSEFGHRKTFESFDDADPFGSTGPFKSSGGHSPKQGSGNWSAF